MNTNNLFYQLNAIKPLSESFKNYLSDHLVDQKYDRGDQLPYRQSVSNTIYFVEDGLVSGTKMINDEKTILWFSNKNHFIVPSLTASREQFIQRLEFLKPTLLIGLELPFARQAIKLFPEALELFLGIIDKTIAESNERELFLRLSAEKRHQSIAAIIPFIFSECPSENLASYLNISLTQHYRIKMALLKKPKP